MQNNNQDKIAWNDKDTASTLKNVFDIGTRLVFNHVNRFIYSYENNKLIPDERI